MSETDAADNVDRTDHVDRADEVDRLRRVAFGRTSTAAEESAAGEALTELARVEAQLEAERAAERAAEREAERESERMSAAAAAVPLDDEPPVDAPDDEPVAPARWRRWAAPALVGAVVGALTAGGLVFAFPPTPEVPAALTTTSDAVTDNGASTNVNYFLGDLSETGQDGSTRTDPVSSSGDLEAAARWFAREQTDEDLDGVGSLLPEFDRGSVRLVHASPLARAWVAKRVDGQLCLEVTVSETDYTSGSCALPPEFTETGLTVSTDTVTVRWNGGQVNVLLAQPAE